MFGKNTTETFLFNHVIQVISCEEFMRYFYVSTFIFSLLSLNLIYDLKVIAKICLTVGEYEESHDVMQRDSHKSLKFIKVRELHDARKPDTEVSLIRLETIIELHAHCLV